MTTNIHSLKFKFWNINGHKSKVIGKKIQSRDFLKEIEGNDVIALAETHIHTKILEDLFIPGYTLLSYRNNDCNPKSKTAPGGLAIFHKDGHSKYFVPIERDNKIIVLREIKSAY